MADDDKDPASQTEAPTEKRLRDAREKGDVPSSREVGNMTVVLSLFIIMVFVAPALAPRLTSALATAIDMAGRWQVGSESAGLRDLGGILSAYGRPVVLAAAPVFGVLILAALLGVLVQGDTVVALERIRPKLSKINPLEGFGRLFSRMAFVEFVKNLAKVLVVGVIAVWICWHAVMVILPGSEVLPESLMALLARDAGRVLLATACFLVPVAVIDIVWKRLQWLRKLRMSMQEIKDERKDAEGDPMIRAKRMEIRRRRRRQQLTIAVPKASVVLTNPTHYAVALKYERGVDPAPVCVAKGADLLAAQIRRIARENEIPIIENRALARALYDVVEVDDTVPEAHWQAVAEIVSYVMDLRRRIRRKPPAGSMLRQEP